MTSPTGKGPTLAQTAMILSALVFLLVVTCVAANDVTLAVIFATLIVGLLLALCVVGIIAFLRHRQGSSKPPSLSGD